MIEKGLYNPQAQDMSGPMSDDEAEVMQIIIDNPDAVLISDEDGGMLVEFGQAAPSDADFDANLAEYMDENEMGRLASELLEDYDNDVQSRREWIQTYVDGLELLGMKMEDRSEPWEGACGVYHPLLTEALVKFQAETVMETLPASGPVRTQIVGRETPEKKDAAARVQEDMNYRITSVMTEYRVEHERMIWGLGLSGNAFKKIYFDPNLGREVSLFAPAEDVVVPYGASNLETSPRVTHILRKTANELRRLQVEGFYRDIELGDPSTVLDDVEKKIAEQMGFRATHDDRYRLLEMQVDLDLPGYEDKDEDGKPTGIALPYIVTIDKSSGDVLAIRRNWRPNDELKKRRMHFVHYGYVPGFGFYCFGLIHLVGAFAKSSTSLVRQLVDAGTLSNLPGGLKTRGLRIKGDDTPISPGEFRDVDIASGTLRDNVMPLPYKEPSQVLMTLLGTIVEEGRRFASAADLKVSDMSAQAPVGTTLAILERTLKVMSAVQARVHYSLRRELKLLKEVIRDYLPEDYPYEPDIGNRQAKQADYDMCEVLPVSDPNAATMSQKVVQYQAALQLAAQAPQLYNQALLHRQMLGVLGIKDADKLVKLPEDAKPQDPITENQRLLTMQSVKAFLYQDHKAHIAVHMAAAQDPLMQQMLQQNPMAQQILAAAMAHVSEHLAMDYRKEMEAAMGLSLPDPDDTDADEGDKMTPEMETQISQMAAQAAQQLLQNHSQQAQQAQQQQQQQDPLIQLQAQELQLKAQDLEIKKQKMVLDAAAKADQLQVEKERIALQAQTAGAQIGAKVAKDKQDMQAKQQAMGVKLGIEVGKVKMQDEANRRRQRTDVIKSVTGRDNRQRTADDRDTVAKKRDK